jgi:hypothetical protein
MSAPVGRSAAVACLAGAGLVAVALAASADGPPHRPAAARLADAAAVRKQLGLSPAYQSVAGLDRVKVAVLDYGFDGVDGRRPYLPADTVVVEHYDPELVRRFGLGDADYRKGFEPGNYHGRQMAQLVWAVTGSRPDGPKFYLLNANGPTLFRRAVRYAVEAGVDVILFSGVFEGGGNYDGRGPINRAVDDAVRAGILWVNAAGNFGRQVYNGPVKVLADGYVQLGPNPTGTALRFRNRLDEATITVTLTWNDYREAEDAGTRKDLDLFVEDWDGAAVASAEAVQVDGNTPAGPSQSHNPRERLVLEGLAADPGRPYRIRVKAKAGTFAPADRLRILVTSAQHVAAADPETGRPVPAIELLDATGTEEIYPPADDPGVVTVGDSGPASGVGPTADGRLKPDVLIADSRAVFTNGEATAGSSNAAAYFAGVAAVLRAAQPGLRAEHLRRYAAALETSAVVRRETSPPPARSAAGAARPRPATAGPGVRSTGGPTLESIWQSPYGGEPRFTWRSPDGRVFVYTSRPPGEWPAAVPRPDGGGAGPAPEVLPTPTPDGGPDARAPRASPALALTWPAYGSSPTDSQAERVRARLAKRLWCTPTPAELAALVRP